VALLAMANESLSSATTSSMVWLAASIITRETWAGRDGVAHEAGRVVVVGHNVDLLAAQFLHHRLHARRPSCPARAHRIHVAIARATAIFERAPGLAPAEASTRTILS